MIRQQRTLKAPVEFPGVGIHTGKQAMLRFKPAPPNTGVVFRTLQGGEVVQLPATVEHVPPELKVLRNTTLSKGEAEIHTVEHVLATLFGLSIDNCILELDANEPPEPEDGSCLPFVEKLLETGIESQGVPATYFEVRNPVQWSREGIGITAIPYDGFRISFTIQYDNPIIGTQYASFDIDPDSFAREIAPARTFALQRDVNHLQGLGLIRGGTLNNAVVVAENEILNEAPLRFPDEFVRHKILDLLGDLSLLGMPIKGHVISLKSGHESNVQFVRKLADQERGQTRVYPAKKPTHWDIQSIMKVMPHRYPFLLVDRILELEDGVRVAGIKNVTINEPFFQGHFPGHPIMPGVLVLEAMAQMGGVLLMSMIEEPESKLVYFTSIDKARFRKPVLPGDQLRVELELLKFKRNTCKMAAVAQVDGARVAEAELLAAVVNR